MKKLWLPAIILLICAFIITGCGTSSSTPTQPSVTTPSSTVAGTSTPAMTKPATTINTPSSTSPATTTKPAATASASITPASTSTPKYGGTLKIIDASAPGVPIGWIHESSGTALRTTAICLDLLLHEDHFGEMSPNLAASYEVDTSPVSSSMTFNLRKGLKFHDGTEFNAQAVKWNFEQGKNGTMVAINRYWKSIEAIDDYTIKVNFTEWQNRHIRAFAAPGSFLMSPTAYEKNGLDWIRWHMVGMGAFKQVNFQRDVTLTTTKFDGYWEQGKPYLDGLQLLYVADELTRLALFKSGGADILDVAGNYKVANDLKSSGYIINTKQGGTTFLVPDSLNAESPWSNIKVRLATEYAIDKDAMSKAFGYGFTQAAYQLALPGSKASVPNIASRSYDVSKAKQILSEAGYPNGFKTRIIGSIVDRDVVVAIQSYLGKIGINAELEFPEPARLSQYQTGTWNNALLYGSVLYRANFNDVLNLWFGVPTSWYKSMKKPDGWESMFKATLNSRLPESDLMQKCVKALYDDQTIIPISYGTSMWATTDKVNDAGLGSRGTPDHFNPQNAWFSK
jgi:peptide/nickel transport system substrate-binding protein